MDYKWEYLDTPNGQTIVLTLVVNEPFFGAGYPVTIQIPIDEFAEKLREAGYKLEKD